MKSKIPNQPWPIRGYRLLLRLYPAAHRQRFGQGMDQLFRNQLRSSRAGDPSWSLARLIARTLLDFIRTCPAAHSEELRRTFSMKRPTSLASPASPASPALFALLAGGLVIALIVTGTMVNTALMPRTYSSIVRLTVERVSLSSDANTRPSTPPAFDQYEFETMRQEILSPKVLELVATKLDLGRRWGTNDGGNQPWPLRETVIRLSNSIDLHRSRYLLIELTAYDQDPEIAAAIANTLANTCSEYRRNLVPAGNFAIRVFDVATPGLRPVRPNIPENLMLAVLTGIALGIPVAGIVGFGALWIRRRTMPPPRASLPG